MSHLIYYAANSWLAYIGAWNIIVIQGIVTTIIFLFVILYNNILLKSRIKEIELIEENNRRVMDAIRKEMAIDFHDEMGNHLASIITMVSTLSIKLSESDKSISDVLIKLENSSKFLYKGTKEFIWSMDPQSDNLFEVLTYLRDKGVEFFANTNIMFKVTRHFSDNARAITLPIGTSRHLLGIFKEAMTNCLIHSNADELTIDSKINQATGGYEIILSDNGQGLKEEDTNKSTKGFYNMDTRAEKINAELILENNQPHGLKVAVKYTPLFGGN